MKSFFRGGVFSSLHNSYLEDLSQLGEIGSTEMLASLADLFISEAKQIGQYPNLLMPKVRSEK